MNLRRFLWQWAFGAPPLEAPLEIDVTLMTPFFFLSIDKFYQESRRDQQLCMWCYSIVSSSLSHCVLLLHYRDHLLGTPRLDVSGCSILIPSLATKFCQSTRLILSFPSRGTPSSILTALSSFWLVQTGPKNEPWQPLDILLFILVWDKDEEEDVKCLLQQVPWFFWRRRRCIS